MTYGLGIWGNFAAMVSIYARDGTVAVAHGGIEMGQGINTKVSLVGIDASSIIVIVKLVCIASEQSCENNSCRMVLNVSEA
jgi:xanthine dehydrogenase molybdopterin-binding subunit B